MSSFQFDTAKLIISEPGAVKSLPDLCRKLGIGKPLVVCDQGIVQAGLLATLEKVFDSAGLEPLVFADVVADPPEDIVESCALLARQENTDGVIGFGGGSSMDVAKLVALMARSDERLADIYGVDLVKGQRLPLIQIPTTAGTGSEVTAVAVVTTGETTKAGVVSTVLLPDVALLDGELTTGLPPFVTASTGIDAMVHAIEAYTSKIKKNIYSDMLARRALQLMAANIQTAFSRGSDIDARQAMLVGACLAGQAFANAPVAAVHALAYPLGGHYHIPHGLSNSLVLPQVLRFNRELAADLYAELHDLLLPLPANLMSDKEKTDRLINWLEELIAELSLPATLKEANVPEEDLPMLVRDAMLQQRLLINNPREVTEQDALEIYQAAY
ncbi:iron-containing alcohol dehydrogenase [Emcibacter sp.]|uniref:iron-containing alcohol dehydrogenase n=1 Tax=Emcibacter sp. TaxID=1979954 RepID=UPI003A8D72DC